MSVIIPKSFRKCDICGKVICNDEDGKGQWYYKFRQPRKHHYSVSIERDIKRGPLGWAAEIDGSFDMCEECFHEFVEIIKERTEQ